MGAQNDLQQEWPVGAPLCRWFGVNHQQRIDADQQVD